MRPFLSPKRCPGCEIRKALCFCDLIPKLETKTRVLILMHTCEEVLTSNTAKLAAKSLTNSELRIHGREHTPMSFDGLIGPDCTSLLLFPSAKAIVLDTDWVSTIDKPIQLIVPDASWRQTTRFVRRTHGLAGIQHVKLPPGPPSEYLLRAQATDENLCTLEAIARALGILESESVKRQLEWILRVLVERTLWSRGQLKASECKVAGIPIEAQC